VYVPKAPFTHTKLGYFIKIWIRSVHMCSCEASLAHEYSLTTLIFVAYGLNYLTTSICSR